MTRKAGRPLLAAEEPGRVVSELSYFIRGQLAITMRGFHGSFARDPGGDKTSRDSIARVE